MRERAPVAFPKSPNNTTKVRVERSLARFSIRDLGNTEYIQARRTVKSGGRSSHQGVSNVTKDRLDIATNQFTVHGTDCTREPGKVSDLSPQRLLVNPRDNLVHGHPHLPQLSIRATVVGQHLQQ